MLKGIWKPAPDHRSDLTETENEVFLNVAEGNDEKKHTTITYEVLTQVLLA